MRLLFVHQNFPGQYLHLANYYSADSANEVVAITASDNQQPEMVRTIRYPVPEPVAASPVSLASDFVTHVARGQAVAKAAECLRQEVFLPDVILGHFAWGETLFLKDVWPRAKLLVYAEYFYGGEDGDRNFDPEFRVADLPARMKSRARNASLMLALAAADRGLAPTQWQRSRFPADLQAKIDVAYDGIDTDRVKPDPAARVTLKGARVVLQPGDEVVTFVSRNLEPYRGYHIFMRALPQILRARPQARAIIIGGDGVSYGPAAPQGRKWRDVFLNEVKERLDLSRVHIVGRLPYDVLLQVLQVSAAHVYLTYPFILSWSMLEAMAAGALVIGSDTAPVREVIRHGHNGLLVNFFEADALAVCVIDALATSERYQPLRQAARRTIVESYDLRSLCLPRQTELIGRLAAGDFVH